MYEGFLSRADNLQMGKFHRASWPERAEIAETFEDERYRELARRLVYEYQPAAIDEALRTRLDVWLENRRHGRDGIEAGRTLEDAQRKVEELKDEGEPNSDLAQIVSWLFSLS